VKQFLREPLSGWSISVKDGKFEKVLSVQVSDALPPSVWRSRPDPNAGKTGGQAWGMKSLYDALTLVIGRLKTVVDLASGLSRDGTDVRSRRHLDCAHPRLATAASCPHWRKSI